MKGLSSDDYTDIELTNMRKTIASRLSESKNTIPHYYLTSRVLKKLFFQGYFLENSKFNDI